jgi:hypothetical protein
MKTQHIIFAIILAYFWVLVIFLGAIIFDTLILYPNVFHDVSRSLEAAMAFMVVRGPRDFFMPVGILTTLRGHAGGRVRL